MNDAINHHFDSSFKSNFNLLYPSSSSLTINFRIHLIPSIQTRHYKCLDQLKEQSNRWMHHTQILNLLLNEFDLMMLHVKMQITITTTIMPTITNRVLQPQQIHSLVQVNCLLHYQHKFTINEQF